MNKKIKMACLVVAILVLGCDDEYRSIPRVCVNYLKHDQYCGTGFFIAPDTLITADHIVAKADDGVLTIVGPGPNEEIKKFTRRLGDMDVTIAHSGHDITDNTLSICTKIVDEADVEMLGNGKRYKEPDVKKGTLFAASYNALYIKGTVKTGYSGGPIIDVEQDCVIGSIIGLIDEYTLGANLVKLLKQSSN